MHKILVSYPEVVNFNANDICNSSCVMCNIWKQKRDSEITPDQLMRVLSNPLFTRLKYVGITGGEPTLRKDLAQLYEAIIKARPNINGLSIITNGIRLDQVKERISEVNALCKSHSISFSVMVSLDGVGEVHDHIRGTKGNFDNAIALIRYLKEVERIPVSAGCTISKDNVWEVDELLDYVKKENIYTRFRVAEFINRLYNQDRADVIRNFTQEETYQLMIFFKKLELSYEKDETVKRTYRSIVNMLGGEKRTIGCPYQTSGLVLNTKGDISYCAPKSEVLGNAIQDDPNQLYLENLDHRVSLMESKCDDCIHDYHSGITIQEYLNELKRKFWKWAINRYINKKAIAISLIPRFRKSVSEKNVLIVGWYGTETVGDKAILKGIIDIYLEKYENVHFTIASIHPFVTRKTIIELGVKGKCDIIGSFSLDLIQAARYSEETIMGGGPLMEIDELSIPYIAFSIAKIYKKRRVILGCGIGPLKNEWSKVLVGKILKLASEIKLRDQGSKLLAQSLVDLGDIEVIDDPAKITIKKLAKTKVVKSDYMACFLREWTEEYSNDSNGFVEKRVNFEDGLAKCIRNMAREMNLEKIHFYHMHNFVVGHDDREFSRRFVDKYFHNSEFEILIDKKLSTVDTILNAMLGSKINLCMRFHSVLFAHTLDTEFIGIDYTLGGKIKFYLEENGVADKLMTFSDICDYESSSPYNIH